MSYTVKAVDFTIKSCYIIQLNSWDVDLELIHENLPDTGYSSF